MRPYAARCPAAPHPALALALLFPPPTPQDVAPAGLHSVFERFRSILHEGSIDKRVQYMIEGLFAIRKAGFAASGHPAVQPALDLVDEEDAITHEMSLEEKHDPQAALNVFQVRGCGGEGVGSDGAFNGKGGLGGGQHDPQAALNVLQVWGHGVGVRRCVLLQRVHSLPTLHSRPSLLKHTACANTGGRAVYGARGAVQGDHA